MIADRDDMVRLKSFCHRVKFAAKSTTVAMQWGVCSRCLASVEEKDGTPLEGDMHAGSSQCTAVVLCCTNAVSNTAEQTVHDM